MGGWVGVCGWVGACVRACVCVCQAQKNVIEELRDKVFSLAVFWN